MKKTSDMAASRTCGTFMRCLLGGVFLAGSMLFSAEALAARTVNSVTLNGATSVTVAPGATISIVINVTTTGSGSNNDWESTGWAIYSGTTLISGDCVNHGDHGSAGTNSETFTLAAPASAGDYTAYFAAYEDDACNTGRSGIFTMPDAITVVEAPPAVASINLASGNPTVAATAVSWTVVFDKSVTGVNASDFILVAGGSVTGAAITSVTGSGTTWTVNANTGSGSGTLGLNLVDDDSITDSGGRSLGGTGTGNGNFAGQVYTVSPPFCSPPAGAPAGLTCHCDTFGRASLNPSTIFDANWIVSTSDNTGIVPSIVNQNYLRLTNNTAANAKAATVPGIFPAAGNYISVEFQHYAYNGSGADGIAVTLSDYAVPPVPGAFGGSLGYAPKSNPGSDCTRAGGCPGFQGGWIGVAIDEYGNFQNPTEGRLGGPGPVAQSVSIRGSGAGQTGYRWLGGTSGLGTSIDNRTSTNPSRGYYYQVIVDARAPTATAVAVNRDTGSGYTSLISMPNIFAAAAAQGTTQAAVPDNWQISFTGSTGGATNIHEIGGLRICAQTVQPPSGGTASGFAVIDEGYGALPLAVQNYLTGHIYMKLVGTPFKLNVAALDNNQIQTTYAAGGNRPVTLKLVDNSDGACVLDSTQANYCSSTCTGKAAVAGGSQTLTFTSSDRGQKQSANFTLNTAYRNLVAVVNDGTTTACSTDAFSVRPMGVASVTSTDPTNATTPATNAGTSGTPVFKAGADRFPLLATVSGVAGNASGYNGILKINNAEIIPVGPAGGPAWVAGAVSPAAFSGATPATGASTAVNNTFTYSEVGVFRLPGYAPAANPDSPRGVYDDTWSAVDSISSRGDCTAGVVGSYSNTKDANGKYGCNFGIVGDAGPFGRFIPDRFGLSGATIVDRTLAGCSAESPFTYMGEPFRVSFSLSALNSGGNVTRNYAGAYAKLATTNWLNYGAPDSVGLWMVATAYPVATDTCKVVFSGTAPTYATSFACAGGTTPPSINRTAGARVAIPSTPAAPNWVNGVSAFSGDVVLERADAADGSYETLNIGIAPQDADGVTLSAHDLDADSTAGNERTSLGATKLRYGRLMIPNNYGSDQLGLPVRVQAQYWTGTAYVKNGDDSCTPLAPATFAIVPGNGVAISTSVVSASAMNAGGSLVELARPTPSPSGKGSIILKTSATAPAAWPLGRYLQGSGVETFGANKKAQVIYLRELY